MRGILSSFIVVSVLFAFPVVSAVAAPTNTEIKYFKAKVTTSINGESSHCFAFTTDGILMVAPLTGVVLPINSMYVWDFKKLGTSPFGWQALDQAQQAQLSGTMSFLGLHGDGIDEARTTYQFKGIRVRTPCLDPS